MDQAAIALETARRPEGHHVFANPPIQVCCDKSMIHSVLLRRASNRFAMRYPSLLYMALIVFLAGTAVRPASGQSPAELQPTAERIQLAQSEVARLVDLLQLKPGITVADVGAGFGAWTFSFSRWTGPTGHVFATDIADEALVVLRALATRERLSNVTVLVGAPVDKPPCRVLRCRPASQRGRFRHPCQA